MGSGGGIYGNVSGSVTNSIIARNNPGGNCGSSFSGANNLADDDTCGFTNSSAILLGQQGYYGGSTQTVPLLPGSAAIAAGDATVCGASPVNNLDQRGFTRPDDHCDAGAFQAQGFAFTKTGDNQSTAINTAFATPLGLTVTPNNAVEPVNGGRVTFTAPAIGASATFAPAADKTIANKAVLVNVTANGVGGPYGIAASAGGPYAAIFSLTNRGATADLSITNSDGVTSAVPGTGVTYTIVVNNAGPTTYPVWA